MESKFDSAYPIRTLTGTVIDSPRYVRGDRTPHEHFHLRTAEGTTVELVENLKLAPWIPAQPGDAISAHGEYIAHGRNGEPVLHWLHDDPRGVHENGWVSLRGVRYE